MKNVQKGAQITIQRLKEQLQAREINRYYCASLFGYLLEAEEAQIISLAWRRHIDMAQAEQVVAMNREWLTQHWNETFCQLKHILEYGGPLIYEEAMQVVSLRSGLQSVARFLPPEYAEQLHELTPLLSESLEQNAKAYDECRKQKTIGIEKHIPKCWWWRGAQDPLE